jgi:hypothetical protein
MKKHGGTDHIQGQLNRGTKPKPNPFHAGSGWPHGVVHDAPTRPAVNAGGTFGMGTLKKGKRK